jgi:replication-associated recombination protein RarA
MSYELRTNNGYDFYEVASAMQKAIRRGDSKLAGYFALELHESNYTNYVWKRLLTISAEDVWGLITEEIWSLKRSYDFVREKKNKGGRIFVSKAVLLLCAAKKSRDSDHLQNLVYDKHIGLTDDEVNAYFDDVRKNPIPVPEYAFDIHTKKGRIRGKTKKDFFAEEQEALNNRQPGLFDGQLKEYLG